MYNSKANTTGSYNIANDVSTLKTFYVDGNNPEVGDGSIINPFQTMEQARTKVIGSGSVTNPQYSGVAIKVAAYTYTTFTGNLYIYNTTWIFETGTRVEYTDTNYFIDGDISIVGTYDRPFKVLGELELMITTGGFIRNSNAGQSVNNHGVMHIEVSRVEGGKPLADGDTPEDFPLIYLNKVGINGGYQSPSVNLIITDTVISVNYNTVQVNGAANIRITGKRKESVIGYGNRYDPIFTGAYLPGVPGGRLLSYTGNTTESDLRKYTGFFSFSNISLAGNYCDTMLYLEGFYGLQCGIDDCKIIGTRGDSIVKRFLEFSNWEPAGYNGVGEIVTFLMRGVVVKDLQFTEPSSVIRYVGTDPILNKLGMQYCLFKDGLEIDSTVYIGEVDSGPVINNINGQLKVSNLQEYLDNDDAISNGLSIGDLYRDDKGLIYSVF